MKRIAAPVLFLGLAMGAQGAVRPGSQAPGFTLPDARGGSHSLSDHAGSWVVLEWTNPDCPFVGRHYGSGAMQELQKAWRKRRVIWFSINSSAPGKQGGLQGDSLRKRIAGMQACPTAYLLDPDGKVGRLYGARSTPHMFVVDPRGTVVYAGAIDDRPSARPEDAAGAVDYVSAALEAGMAGRPVRPAATTPYGCAVKY